MDETHYHMTVKNFTVAIFAMLLTLPVSGQIRFKYDLDFNLMFDNREYDKNGFQESCTLFGVRLAPTVGFDAAVGRTTHRFMAGVDALAQFGTSDKEIKPDLLCWYQLGLKFNSTDFKLTAGMMPRRFMQSGMSPLFFSDYLMFYDSRLEGLILSWDRPKSHFELGLDWLGMIGARRREEFMVFTSGRVQPLKWLKLNYDVYMLHYACSFSVPQVCDNILSEVAATFDFAPMTGLQALSLQTGWIQTLQRDRANVGHFVAPYACELVATLQHWGAGVQNRFVLGRNLMPYSHCTDSDGTPYGGNFYLGDPFFQLVDPSWSMWSDIGNGKTSDIQKGLYDRVELYYAPKICRGVSLKLSVFFHFHRHQYSGTNQMFNLVFNLEELMAAARERKSPSSAL